MVMSGLWSRVVPLVVAVVFPVSLLAAPSAVGATPESDYAADVVKATNTARANHGVGRLRTNACLQRFARAQAERMAAQGRMSHQSLRPIQRACRVGFVGENVAVGYPTGRVAVRSWMRSSGHRANILSRNYRLIGVAARRDGNTWYVAQVFGRKL